MIFWIFYNIIIVLASILAMAMLGLTLGDLLPLVFPLLAGGALLIFILPRLFVMKWGSANKLQG